ncbi:fatty acid desaturase [Acerihabitans arboris]|uniref:Fatty acid desaturase n=1 Tax=Acerihabitans arboris TaxID=2691583 RepID=A0A845SSC8_9GAMM|nr:fatty acid desaturase [Acerihabitans arboris]NDL64005.1 fatty acid desaturase [Acerihabitans arboris]
MAICIYGILALEHWLPRLFPQGLLGLAFAHGVELQHQALHHTGFRSRRANHYAGFLLGLPMLVSYSAYRDSHLFHHQALGRPDDEEFFKHDKTSGSPLRHKVKHIFMLPHFYCQLLKFTDACKGRAFPLKIAAGDAAMIRKEYLLMGGVFFTAALGSLAAGSDIFIQCWLVPLFFVAAPVHSLIEFPEHYGCDRFGARVFDNTRTIHTHPIISWFTNGNNYHVEHHALPSLPMEQLAWVHHQMKGEMRYYCHSYAAFYRQVISQAWTRRRHAKTNSHQEK